MNWAEERWVKLYTRDTPEWAAVSLGARGLFYELTRKVDGAGQLHLGRKGVHALAACVRGELAQVTEALTELLQDGCVVLDGETLVIPNSVEAQAARTSDTIRKRMQRGRDRDQLLAAGMPEQHSGMAVDLLAKQARASHAVTPSHTPSPPVVTPSPAESHDVTPGHAESRREESRREESRRDQTREEPPPAEERRGVPRVVEAPDSPPEAWVGDDFWRWFQSKRQEAGFVAEKPPHPAKLGAWWSEATGAVRGDVLALKQAVYRFGEDKYWQARDPPLPFQAFMAQWAKYAPRREADDARP